MIINILFLYGFRVKAPVFITMYKTSDLSVHIPVLFSLLKLPQNFVHSKMQKSPEEAVPVERDFTCSILHTTQQNV